MDSIKQVCITITFEDGSRRREYLYPHNMSYFWEQELSDLLGLDRRGLRDL